MIVETLVVGALQTNCYVLGCEQTRQAWVIDPGDDPAAIQAVLSRYGWLLTGILLTHAHFDHLLAVRPLQAVTAAPLYLHRAERRVLDLARRMTLAWMGHDPGAPPRVDGDLEHAQLLRAGGMVLEVRLTAGHSPGGVTFVDHVGRRAFTGDALFAGSIGRTDLPGGDMSLLLASIRAHILSLPDDYVLLPGHGPATTVGQERRGNPFLVDDE